MKNRQKVKVQLPSNHFEIVELLLCHTRCFTGSSGVDENSEVDDGEMDYDDEDDDGWNTKGYKQKKKRDGSHHSEAMLNNCLDRKGRNEYRCVVSIV